MLNTLLVACELRTGVQVASKSLVDTAEKAWV